MARVRGHYRRTSSGGVTYVRPHTRTTPVDASGIVALLLLGAVAFVVAVIVWIVQVMASIIVELVVVITIAAVASGIGFVIVAAIRATQRKRTARYLELCENFVEKGSLDAEGMREMESLGGKLAPDLDYRTFGEETIYQDFVAQILADGHIDQRERTVLRYLDNLFALDPMAAKRIKQNAFVGFLNALWGHFDEGREQQVRDVAEGLGLVSDDIGRYVRPLIEHQEALRQQQVEHAARVAEAERIAADKQEAREREYLLAAQVYDADERQSIASSVRLTKNETPWYETRAVEVKHLKKGAQRRKGKLIVTNRRLVFVSDGTVAIQLNKVLDVAADIEEGTLHLVKDGRKRPYDFEVELPLVAMAHVERSMGEMA